MAADANWQLTEPDGAEYGGCCISATLRDYGRLGLFALSEGVLPDDTRVLPEGWMAESTTPSAANPGYGYYWWLNQMPNSYSAVGVFGQMIWIDPTEEVLTQVWSWGEGLGRAAPQLGEAQRLTSGHTLVNYGTTATVLELAGDEVVWELDWGPDAALGHMVWLDTLFGTP